MSNYDDDVEPLFLYKGYIARQVDGAQGGGYTYSVYSHEGYQMDRSIIEGLQTMREVKIWIHGRESWKNDD